MLKRLMTYGNVNHPLETGPSCSSSISSSLYFSSEAGLSHQTCWKLHLMLQFQSDNEQSFAQLPSGSSTEMGDFML